MKDKMFLKVRNFCLDTGGYRDGAHTICSLKYSVPKNIHIAFHNESIVLS